MPSGARLETLIAGSRRRRRRLFGRRGFIVPHGGEPRGARRDARLAVTAVSPSLARRELEGARDLARRAGLEPRRRRNARGRRARNTPINDGDRCYWCKTELFEVLGPMAEARSSEVLVGTNLDDLGDYRPGSRAAAEHEVRAPLVEAGLTKAEIRSMSSSHGATDRGQAGVAVSLVSVRVRRASDAGGPPARRKRRRVRAFARLRDPARARSR